MYICFEYFHKDRTFSQQDSGLSQGFMISVSKRKAVIKFCQIDITKNSWKKDQRIWYEISEYLFLKLLKNHLIEFELRLIVFFRNDFCDLEEDSSRTVSQM